MAFYDDVPFPECISARMTASIKYAADAAYGMGGQRFFNLYDVEPIREYQFALPPSDAEEYEMFRAFFLAVRGVDAFLYKDWSDYQLTEDNSSMTLITGSTYQLNRLYVSPGRTVTRPIYKPAAGLVVLRTRSSVTTDITGSSTIDFDTGQVVVTGHMSGDTYSAEGEFYVPAYFMVPEAAFSAMNASSILLEWPDIVVRESREIA